MGSLTKNTVEIVRKGRNLPPIRATNYLLGPDDPHHGRYICNFFPSTNGIDALDRNKNIIIEKIANFYGRDIVLTKTFTYVCYTEMCILRKLRTHNLVIKQIISENLIFVERLK